MKKCLSCNAPRVDALFCQDCFEGWAKCLLLAAFGVLYVLVCFVWN